MALRTAYQTRGGLPVADAYVRVTDMHIARVGGEFRLAFRVAAFVDQATASQAHRTLDEPTGRQCPYDLAGPNPYEQAYVWLTEGAPAVGEPGEEGYVPAQPALYPDAQQA